MGGHAFLPKIQKDFAMTKTPDNEHLPQHVAIIMDGNGRWAKQRGLPRSEGHKQGAKVFKRICEYAADIGIRYVTFYAFSTETGADRQRKSAA